MHYTSHISYWKAKWRKYRKIFNVKNRGKDMSSSETGVNNWSISQFQKGSNKVSGRVSVPCWSAAPFDNAPWKPFVIRWRSSSVSKVMKLVKTLIGWEITKGFSRGSDGRYGFEKYCKLYCVKHSSSNEKWFELSTNTVLATKFPTYFNSTLLCFSENSSKLCCINRTFPRCVAHSKDV